MRGVRDSSRAEEPRPSHQTCPVLLPSRSMASTPAPNASHSRRMKTCAEGEGCGDCAQGEGCADVAGQVSGKVACSEPQDLAGEARHTHARTLKHTHAAQKGVSALN